ncbi:MAG TPA: endonuclease [Taishania sp.]|nr:endonuclease [Taishania sp.]
MKKLVLTLSLFATTSLFAQVISIADARNAGVGQTVTVKGVVTNGSELGNIRYLQDETGGIAAFGGSISGINRYDSITVTGPLTEFNGLLEIGTGQSGGNPTYTNHGAAVVIPQPLVVPISAVNESIEGQLITISNVTFTTTGSFASGNSTVQITNGSQTFDVRINGSTNIDGTAIPTGTVSITGVVGQFGANYQIIPRDLNDIVAYVAPVREINVLVDGTIRLSGSTIYLGAATNATITIENLGVGNLNITNTAFSGAQAAAFSTNIANGTLGASSSTPYTLTIAPIAPGTHEATLTIYSDDDDEDEYILNFQAGGTDGLATAPTSNPTNLTFPVNKAYKLNGQFTAGTGATNYIVLWSNGSAVTGVPVDGTSYLRGDQIGNAKVAYVGTATGFSPRGIIANQNYHFAIYAFNGQGGIENYLTTAPLVGNVTSGGAEIGSYYAGINHNNATLAADLKALTNPHTMITYYNYLQTMMNNFVLRDTTGGESFVECYYSGHKEVFSGPFAWTAQDFSREHVFAHSWMPGNPYNSPEKPQYTDQHNLLPTKMTDVNGARGNRPFGEVITPNFTFMGTKRGVDANGNEVYEPRDEIKGDVARCLMYEAVTYNGTNGTWAFPSFISFIFPYGQNADVILQWHFQDPPSDLEIARNEYIYSIQGNRNPFIDSVDFACYIDFSTMNYDADACGDLGTTTIATPADVMVYPIPANETINIVSPKFEISAIELVDNQGRIVVANNNIANTVAHINVNTVTSGIYLVNIHTTNGTITQRVVIQ